MIKSLRHPGRIRENGRFSFLLTGASALLLGLTGALSLFPFLHIMAKSISSYTAVTAGKVLFWPIGLNTDTFSYLFQKTMILRAFLNSVILTGAGTVITTVSTVASAYPLSRTGFRGRKFFLGWFIFAMLFNGGMVPNYMMIRALGLMDSYMAIILPFMIIPFNMLVVKTYMEGIPEEIEESARIDGASQIRTLVSIIVPMASPAIATVLLLYAVNFWNNYFHAMLYISTPIKRPLQYVLYEIVNEASTLRDQIGSDEMMNLTSGGVVSASVVVSTVPILCLYPMLQRYFVGGLTIGSVKG